jgi:hypothetical protein
MLAGMAAFVGTFCGLIPPVPPPLIVVKAACFGGAAALFAALRGTFKRAQEKGQCVELRFSSLPPHGLVGWKVVKC